VVRVSSFPLLSSSVFITLGGGKEGKELEDVRGLSTNHGEEEEEGDDGSLPLGAKRSTSSNLDLLFDRQQPWCITIPFQSAPNKKNLD
jgi:hypothetical protein